MLAARLCHELAGPISALANGAELLDEPGSGFDREVLALVGDSARRASSRLQFYRFAYGFSGDAWSGSPVRQLVAGYFEGSATVCDLAAAFDELPIERQQLGCNLMVIGAEALAHGGRLVFDTAPAELRLAVAGEAVSLARERFDALTLSVPVEGLSPRTIHAYFTGLLARAQGLRVTAQWPAPGRLCLAATALAV